MSDYASRYTDKRQVILENRLGRVYLEAQKQLREKMADFMDYYTRIDAEKRASLDAGAITKDEYRTWKQTMVFNSKRWKAKVKSATIVLQKSNEKALTIIRDEQMNVFAENANWEAYRAERKTGYDPGVSFDIYDVSTVDRLVREKPELLPRKTVNGKKDRAWNQGVIMNSITQSIIQGESIPETARRLARDTASTDRKAMIRYARTAMTGAQNAGRMETLTRAQGMGIRVKKQWLATLDGRTRDSHQALDGVIADVKDKFPNGLMYPGDPAGPAGEVYNCRCTLVYVYPDYPEENAKRRDNETGALVDDMTYSEWTEWKKSEENKKPLFEDDSKWFREGLRPGKGKVEEPKKKTSPDHPHEVAVAEAIRDTFGGYVKMLEQAGHKKVADYKWKGLEWELKRATSRNAVDKRTKKAIEKMNAIKCEIMIDVQMDEIELAKQIIRKKVKDLANRSCRVVVLNYGEVVSAWRYNKRR